MKRFVTATTSGVLLVSMVALSGCDDSTAIERLTQQPPRATDVDPELASPDYWLKKPPTVTFKATDYDKLLSAIQDSFRRRFFVIYSADARSGIVMSERQTASQFFEPWRQDNSTAGDVARASLGTYARTVLIQITKLRDGTYSVAPKVLVERQAIIGRRVSGVLGFQTFTELDQASISRKYQGETIPGNYWYAVRRDENLEQTLAEDIQERLAEQED